MSVVINGIRNIDDKIQLCFMTITCDGQDYKYLANIPVLAGPALQAHVDSKEDRWVYNILYQEYPGARYKQLEGNSDFAKLQQWITDGHVNIAHCLISEHETEQPCIDAECTWISAEVIEKVPFVNSHDYAGTLTDRKLEEICLAVNQYIYAHYDAGAQNSFQAIYVMNSTPVAVKDTLLMVWTWVQSVLVYYYTKKAEIIAASDPASVTWDFSTFDATDPQLSLQSLMI